MKHVSLLITIVLLSVTGYSQESGYEPGQLLVQFKNGTDTDALIRQFQEEQNIKINEFVQLSRLANIYQIKFEDTSIDLDNATFLLYTYRQVNTVQKNHYITTRETIPTDTLFAQQWHHKNTGQTGGTLDADIDTPDAWDITTGGITTHNDTIVVCVIEGNGVDISHVDLVDNIWHNYAEIPNNGMDDDNNGYVDDFDGWNVATLNDQVGSGNHGTRVAGMIGATGNNVTGVSGVNWNVKMMIVKGQVASNESSVIAAYDYPLTMRKMYNDSYGQEGAFVVATNASWGIDNGDPADAPLWCAMYDTLGAYGILNIAATTNNNADVDANGDLPTACPSQYLIGVTMTDDTDDRANSGYGPTHVDLGAPGSSVYLPFNGNLYITTNGTSFASPCVAGAVALAYSAPCPEFIDYAKYDPSGAAMDMRNYILDNVDVIPALSGEVATDGRLNINNSINAMLSSCSISACQRPFNVHASEFTDTSATFIWEGFSVNYLFYITEGANPEVEIPLVNQDSIYFDTLTACTQYTIRVKGICGSDTSDYSYPFTFTTDGCCNNPAIDYVSAGQDSITISWNSVLYGTQYDIRYRKQGDVSWIATLTDTISPLTVTGLDTCTTYEFQIQTTCTDSTQGFSTSYNYSTLGCGACYEAVYCDVIGANDNLEWIDSIVINGVINVTGQNNGWLQSTNILTSFEAGQTYSVVLKPGYSGTTFTERFSIWIDFNQDGVFDPSEELLGNVNTTTVLTDDITIPITALSGITKMRIGMNGVTTPEPCPTSAFYGEYEDYCVYIGQDAGWNDAQLLIKVYPNPVHQTLNIESSSLIKSIKIFSYDGKEVLFLNESVDQLDVSSFDKGMYILYLQTENGTQILKFVKQ
ncbi:MAG: S8 family serine peptidase [Crocinitomicaceae bacterium]|nr:S8 family serine peptidase [Crocinitomicaceae bacterium]